MGYYCTVPQCTSLAGKTKNVKFHRFPRDETLADKWNDILKRNKPYTKYSKVCSLHFTQADYNITTMGKKSGQWKTLSKDAIPSQNLPKLHPDGTVMVIRKSRSLKFKAEPTEIKLEREDGSDRVSDWVNTSASSTSTVSPGRASVNQSMDTSDASLQYRLNSLNAIANNVSPVTHSATHLRAMLQQSKPPKQDAIMQTDPPSDPLQIDEDAINQDKKSINQSDNDYRNDEYSKVYGDPKNYSKEQYKSNEYSDYPLQSNKRDFEQSKSYGNSPECYKQTDTNEYKGQEYSKVEGNYPKPLNEYPKPHEFAHEEGNYPKSLNEYEKQQDYCKLEGNYPKPLNDYAKEQEYSKEQGNYPKALAEYTKEQDDYTKAQDNYSKHQDSYAKTQDDYAKTQNSYAKTQDDYAKPQDNYPKTQEDYTKTQDNYQKTHDGYTKTQNDYQKSHEYNKSQSTSPTNPTYNREYPDYQKQQYATNYATNTADILRNQQNNLQMLQQHSNRLAEQQAQRMTEELGNRMGEQLISEQLSNRMAEEHAQRMGEHGSRMENAGFYSNRIKEEDLSNEDDKFAVYVHGKKEENGYAQQQVSENVLFTQQQRHHLLQQQQRLMQQLQHKSLYQQDRIKTEPDMTSGCETVLQSQQSPVYYPDAAYYQREEALAQQQLQQQQLAQQQILSQQPGAELLIAKQNALAAHTTLWQNSMKRPFFYSDPQQFNTQLHSRYEDLSRLLNQ